MSMNRRNFVRAGVSAAAVLGGALPLLSAPRAASAETVMPRMALEEFVKDADRVKSLRDGVAAMMALKPSDPGSWFFQSAIHSVRADWLAAAEARDPGVTAVKSFFNHCPHSSAYGSADFLLWHRAYLFYFEGFLRKAAKNPNLSLPYWNYPNAAQRKLPEIYRVPASKDTNPLYIPERTPSLNDGTGQLSPGATSLSALTNKIYFGSTDSNVFGGLIAIGSEPSNKGLIERVPHDAVHGAVGSPGWMGSVPTAAFDPIFWPHHAEIDHLFTLWDCVGEVNWGPYQVSWFDAKPWKFMGADGQVHNEARRFYTNNANLNVRYDDQKPTCKPLPAPTGAVRAANILTEFDSAQAVKLGASGGVQLSASGRTTRVIPLATKKLLGGRSAGVLFGAKSPRKLVIELAGIHFTQPPSVAYDVYVGLPAGTAPNPSGPYHVGQLTFFGLDHEHGGGAEPAVGTLFDVTRLARAKGFDPSKLEVTFVPFDLVVTASGAPGAARRSDVRIETIDVRVVTVTP